MNFMKLQDRLVTYLQTAVSEVVDEMCTKMDIRILTIPLNKFGPRWKQIPITCSHAARYIAIPSLVSSMARGS